MGRLLEHDSLIRNIAEVDEVVRALLLLGVLGAKDRPQSTLISRRLFANRHYRQDSWYNDAAGASADTVVAGSPVRVFHGRLPIIEARNQAVAVSRRVHHRTPIVTLLPIAVEAMPWTLIV